MTQTIQITDLLIGHFALEQLEYYLLDGEESKAILAKYPTDDLTLWTQYSVESLPYGPRDLDRNPDDFNAIFIAPAIAKMAWTIHKAAKGRDILFLILDTVLPGAQMTWTEGKAGIRFINQYFAQYDKMTRRFDVVVRFVDKETK